MARRIAKISGFMVIIIAIYSISALAANNTFSVYGSINDDDGKPIPNATIGLIEPIGNTFYDNESWLRSTVTDSSGSFQLTNVTINSSECGILIKYPDNKKYYNPNNSFRVIPAYGIQIVNVTRDKSLHDAVPTMCDVVSTTVPLTATVTPEPTPFPSGTAVFFTISLAGLLCLYKES